MKYLNSEVATVHTACGIVTTLKFFLSDDRRDFVATVHTACGIVTKNSLIFLNLHPDVATVHTACGIVTFVILIFFCYYESFRLQQFIPLAVL